MNRVKALAFAAFAALLLALGVLSHAPSAEAPKLGVSVGTPWISRDPSAQLGVITAGQRATYAVQTDWAIDPTNGVDTNDGTSAHPIKTHAELMRRIGRFSGTFISAPGRVVVNLLGNLPASDPVRIDIDVAAGTIVHYLGRQTQIYAGSITAFTAYSGNVQPLLTDTALAAANTWTGYISSGYIGKVTSGARAGATFWPGKDMGAKQARISHPTIPPASVFPYNNQGYTFPTLQVGDPYAMFSLTTIGGFYVNINAIPDFGNTGGNFRSLLIENVAIATSGVWTMRAPGGPVIDFVNSDVGLAQVYGGVVESIGSCHRLIQPFPGVQMQNGGLVRDNYIDLEGGAQYEPNMVYVQGIDLTANGGVVLFNGDVGVFDGPGIRSIAGGSIDVEGKIAYGTGNTQGIEVRAGSSVIYKTTKPTITGTNDTRVNGVNKAYATIPFFDTASGAGIVQEVP